MNKQPRSKCSQCGCVQLVCCDLQCGCCDTLDDVCIECCDCSVGQRVRLLARKLAGTEEAALKMLDASGKRAYLLEDKLMTERERHAEAVTHLKGQISGLEIALQMALTELSE